MPIPAQNFWTPRATKPPWTKVIQCLAIDWSHDSAPPLAELFRLASSQIGEGGLLLCLSPRTFRLFPQLETWAREEGFLLGLWLADPSTEPERKSDWILVGEEKNALLTYKEEPQEFTLATHPGELVTPRRTAQGT